MELALREVVKHPPTFHPLEPGEIVDSDRHDELAGHGDSRDQTPTLIVVGEQQSGQRGRITVVIGEDSCRADEVAGLGL